MEVELRPLMRMTLKDLKEPDNSLIKQYKVFLTEDVNIEFSDDGIDILAEISAEVTSVENIGARRLHTIIEKVIDDISFNATDKAGETIIVDEKFVKDNLGNLVKDTDLSKLYYKFFNFIKIASPPSLPASLIKIINLFISGSDLINSGTEYFNFSKSFEI